MQYQIWFRQLYQCFSKIRLSEGTGYLDTDFAALNAESIDFARCQTDIHARCQSILGDKGLDIIIAADGSMFVNGTPLPADAENLRAIIIEKAGSRRDIPVSIVADGDARHAMVVMSMDTVSQLGFKRLSISTQRPAAGE